MFALRFNVKGEPVSTIAMIGSPQLAIMLVTITNLVPYTLTMHLVFCKSFLISNYWQGVKILRQAEQT